MPHALQFLVLTVAGWVNRHQEDVIAYLREENRILREQLGPGPLRLTNAQRRRLAVRGRQLGRRALMQVAELSPRTFCTFVARVVVTPTDAPASSSRS